MTKAFLQGSRNPAATNVVKMEKKYLVIFDRSACIGARSCVAIDPNHWMFFPELNKAELKGSNKQLKNNAVVKETIEISGVDLPAVRDAAVACPANAIKIKEKRTGKEIT